MHSFSPASSSERYKYDCAADGVACLIVCRTKYYYYCSVARASIGKVIKVKLMTAPKDLMHHKINSTLLLSSPRLSPRLALSLFLQFFFEIKTSRAYACMERQRNRRAFPFRILVRSTYDTFHYFYYVSVILFWLGVLAISSRFFLFFFCLACALNERMSANAFIVTLFLLREKFSTFWWNGFGQWNGIGNDQHQRKQRSELEWGEWMRATHVAIR